MVPVPFLIYVSDSPPNSTFNVYFLLLLSVDISLYNAHIPYIPNNMLRLCCISYEQGRMLQVEYAMEATRRGGTVVGVCGDDCVALVTREPPQSSSLRAVPSAGGVWAVDSHVGIAASG